MIVRGGVRLLPGEAVQRATVVEMVFSERPRHAFNADDRRAGRDASDRRPGRRTARHLPLCQSLSTSSIA